MQGPINQQTSAGDPVSLRLSTVKHLPILVQNRSWWSYP